MENQCKRTRTTDASTKNILKIEERLSGIKDKMEKIDTLVKKILNSKISLTQNIQEIGNTV
jgi:DNA anti-recombination protein RmuC